MKNYLVILSFFSLLACKETKEDDSIGRNELETEYKLVWSDEFEGAGQLDSEKWAYEIGFIRNEEEQYYTDSLKNVRLADGFLIIEAHKEPRQNDASYSSASITTKNLAEWQYGKIEVRAKLAKGVGMWPAIWMLGENWKEVGWPECGEIDIMEHVGFDKDVIFGTVHTEAFNHTIGTEVGKSVFVDSPYEEFHVYAVEWTPEKIDFILDGTVYHQFENVGKTEAEWPFDQPFHLKLNLAVGGSWGGQQGIDESVFPQQMTVDYARVYQLQ